MRGFKNKFLRAKIHRILTLLLLLPLCAGLFWGSAEAYEVTADLDCKTKQLCETELESVYKKVNPLKEEIKELSQAINQLEEYSEGIGDAQALEGLKTNRDKKEEELADMYAKEVVPLKIRIQSVKNVDIKKVLSITNQTPFENAGSFLGKVIDLLIKMIGVAALVFLVIGGFRMVVSAGNDNEIQKAKSMIQYAVTGLVVALLAFLIVKFMQGILYR